MKIVTAFAAMSLGWLAAAAPAHAETTTLSGQAYANLCQQRGVPLPPAWGSSAWIPNGVLPSYELLAGQAIGPAFVYYYQSTTTPTGLCMALPRGDQMAPIRTFGVICQGDTGFACFWDDADQNIPWAPSTPIPIVSDAADAKWWGGAQMPASGGGMCTDCHRGENAFVVRPGTPLDLRPAAIAMNRGGVWYKPIVPVGFMDNSDPALSPSPNDPGLNPTEAACTTCHNGTEAGGRFPFLTRAKFNSPKRYCDIIVKQMRDKAWMPPLGAATTASMNIQWDILIGACDAPPLTAIGSDAPDLPSFHDDLAPWLYLPALM